MEKLNNFFLLLFGVENVEEVFGSFGFVLYCAVFLFLLLIIVKGLDVKIFSLSKIRIFFASLSNVFLLFFIFCYFYNLYYDKIKTD